MAVQKTFPWIRKPQNLCKNIIGLIRPLNFFFQPYKVNAKKSWVRSDYPSSGLQAVNTQTFANAFLHEKNTRVWGWGKKYVDVLEEKLTYRKGIKQLIPAFHMAVWLFKDKDWQKNTSTDEILNLFLKEFKITNEEKKALFDLEIPTVQGKNIFQNDLADWGDLRSLLQNAPDSKPDEGGTLTYLETRGLGPAEKFVLEPAERLTIITGDNGLGKTFLLECAWWALTGFWAERQAIPSSDLKQKKVEITVEIKGEKSSAERKTIQFDWKTLSWQHPKNRPTIPGLVVYARVDGSFAVWDPAKQSGPFSTLKEAERAVFTSQEAWDGKPGQIEGLIRDWVSWQSNPQKYPFEMLMKVLQSLSPPDLGVLKPGPSVRILDDPREIPTLIHPYGETSILAASAGVKRILTLAYLIVWSWSEHLVAAKQRRTAPQKRLVILVDEMEAHLHPRWQRAVLPSLLSVVNMLAPELEIQFLIATHSPLVMASAETVFISEKDKLIHLDLVEGKVSLEEVDFHKWGDVSSWLTSPIFELRHARSQEAESAIEEAKKIQLMKKPSVEEVRAISEKLTASLASDDKFWPRWISFAEKFGVNL